MSRNTGKIEIRATALEPIHHGAGSSGNTQLLRTQEILLPDGQSARVPFVSGNSVKHRLRINAVNYALHVMGVEDGALSKAEVDLLFSGGRLSKGGTAVDLARAREMELLFPALSMCGYSAGNTMTSSKIRCSHLHVVCAENAWRLPADLSESPMRLVRAGAVRTEEFGTRHDKMHDPNVTRYLPAAEVEARAEEKAAKAKSKTPPEKGDSLQMIYDFQVLAAGAQLWGQVDYEGLTDLECAALASAFHIGSNGELADGRIRATFGGKSSTGFGAVALSLRGAVRVAPPVYSPSSSLVPTGGDVTDQYHAHLRDNRAAILDAIRKAAS